MRTLARELLIGPDQARRYVKELEREGFIQVDRTNRHYRSTGGGSNRYYFIVHPIFAGGLAAQSSTPPLADVPGVPLARMQAPTPCKNASQRESSSDRKESQKKETRPLRGSLCQEVNESAAPYASVESSVALPGNDDDENLLPRKPPTRERAANPKEEFRALLREWHGPHMDIAGPEEQITRKLEKAGLAWTWGLIDYIRKKTTNPKGLTLNPAGHYVKLAGQFVTDQKTAVMEAVMQQQRAIQALAQQSPEKTERCPKCGYLASPPQSLR